MTNVLVLILLMATRVYEFLVAFPEPNPGFQQATAALGARIARAEVLANQQRAGKVARRVSSAQRKALIKELRSTVLRTLAAVATAAFKDQPDVVRRYRVPAPDGGQSDFITEARAILAEAEAVKDVLLQHGMPETLLAELSAGLDRFEAMVTEANAALRAHVGASADLDAVGDEIMGLVKHLDGLNRFRYRNNPEQLAAWLSARNVPWSTHREDTEETTEPGSVPVPAPAAQQPTV